MPSMGSDAQPLTVQNLCVCDICVYVSQYIYVYVCICGCDAVPSMGNAALPLTV